MTNEYNEVRNGTQVSRRTLAAGAAWAVPTVAIATATPAFAASFQTCFPIDFTTTGSTATGTQQVSVTGTDGVSKTQIPVTSSVTTGYRLPGGTTYTALNMTPTTGGVTMATYAVPTDFVNGVQTVYNGNPTYYSSTKVQYPNGATGPVSFTISDLESYITTANNGASYFTDSVQVLNNGVVVAPKDLSGASYANGWTSAAGTTEGWATYTIDSPGAIEIRLMNAYGDNIPWNAHPNQSVVISDFVCGPTAPTPPRITNVANQYRERASVYGSTSCSSLTSYSTYNINNTTAIGTSPYGFTVVNMPKSDGSGASDTTTITASNVTFVLGLPKVSLNQSKLANPFTFASGGSTWQLDTTKTYEKTMTNPDGTSAVYVIYTFKFIGQSTNSSVANVTSGGRPTSWPGSQFNINVAGGSNCVRLGYFWGGYTGTFTAANGGTVTYDTLPPQWVKMY